MSGGSYDYAYRCVNDMAHAIQQRLDAPEGELRAFHLRGKWVPASHPEAVEARERIAQLRRRFADHLELVAEAMRAIEWVDSEDSSEGAEIAAIEAVLPR